MVMMVGGLLAKKEFFAANENLLDQPGFEQRLENPVNRGSVASFGADPLVDFLRGERSADLLQSFQNGSATRSGLQPGRFELMRHVVKMRTFALRLKRKPHFNKCDKSH